MTIEQINGMSKQDFTDVFGGVYEQSAWVAERTWSGRPFDSFDDLVRKMNAEVDAASEEAQLALVRAHPELGTRLKVSPSSTSEQTGAGLDQLTQREYDMLRQLNDSYRAKFGIPFIYAVKGSDKADIIVALTVRLDSDPETEFQQSLWEVSRIARFRLEGIVKD